MTQPRTCIPFSHLDLEKTMKLSKWLTIPVVALALCLTTTGCGPADNAVIETEQMSDDEIKKADEDYDAQYEAEYENYE